MRPECVRALAYILSSQNALTKSVIFAQASAPTADQLKRFFSICFVYWSDIKKQTDIRSLFAYIRSLELIAGKGKTSDLHNYLRDQILHNPHIKPDLSEEYRLHFISRG